MRPVWRNDFARPGLVKLNDMHHNKGKVDIITRAGQTLTQKLLLIFVICAIFVDRVVWETINLGFICHLAICDLSVGRGAVSKFQKAIWSQTHHYWQSDVEQWDVMLKLNNRMMLFTRKINWKKCTNHTLGTRPGTPPRYTLGTPRHTSAHPQ